MKLIIDCDPGVDDIFALAVAAVAEEANILAITVTHGNTTIDWASINAKLTVNNLFARDKQPPLYIGASQPISTLAEPVHFYFGRDGIANTSNDLFKTETTALRESFYEINKNQVDLHAASKILELVYKNPNEITLVALGPLTNLALALKLANDSHDFTKKIKNLIIMGGNEPKDFANMKNYHGVNYPEFNFKVDPMAAHLVLTHYKCPQIIYTFDCCLRSMEVPLTILSDEFERYVNVSKRCLILKEIGFRHEQQRNTHPTSPLKKTHFYSCDLVTMIGVFQADKCDVQMKRSVKKFDVKIDGGKLDGLLVEVESNNTNEFQDIQLVISLDKEKTFHAFKEYLYKLANLDSN